MPCVAPPSLPPLSSNTSCCLVFFFSPSLRFSLPYFFLLPHLSFHFSPSLSLFPPSLSLSLSPTQSLFLRSWCLVLPSLVTCSEGRKPLPFPSFSTHVPAIRSGKKQKKHAGFVTIHHHFIPGISYQTIHDNENMKTRTNGLYVMVHYSQFIGKNKSCGVSFPSDFCGVSSCVPDYSVHFHSCYPNPDSAF